MQKSVKGSLTTFNTGIGAVHLLMNGPQTGTLRNRGSILDTCKTYPPKVSTQVPECKQLSIQQDSMEIKQPGCEYDYASPQTAEDKKAWR
jgi:hypothetical protein